MHNQSSEVPSEVNKEKTSVQKKKKKTSYF